MLLLRLLYILLFFSLPFSLNNLQLGFGIMLPTEPIEIFVCLVLVVYYKDVFGAVKESVNSILFVFATLYILWSWVSCLFSDLPFITLKYTLIETLHAIVFGLGFIILHKKNPRQFIYCLGAYTFSFVILLGRAWWLHAHHNFAITYSIAAMRPFYNDHPLYGAVAALLVPLWLYVFTKGKEIYSRLPVKIIAILVTGLLVTGLFTSFSRAAWLSFLIAGVLTLPLYVFRKKIYKASILVFGLIVVFFLAVYGLYSFAQTKQAIKNTDLKNQLLSSFNWSYDVANLERLNRYKCAWRMFKERPLTGFGNNCYKFQYHKYQRPAEMTRISLTEPLDNARIGTGGNSHSDYFAALTELGIIGFVLWMGVVITSLVYCFRLLKANAEDVLPIFIFFSLVTFYLHVAVNNFMHEDKISGFVWMMWGILVTLTLGIGKK